MASRTSAALLLLALFGVVLFLQVALADGAGEARKGDVIASSWNGNIDSSTTPSDIDQDVSTDEVDDVEDGELPDVADQGMSAADQGSEEVTDESDEKELGEIQPYVYVPEADEIEVIADDDEDQAQETSVGAHPLARLLGERSSKKCWRKEKCHKFYRWPGCCGKRCVNFSKNNRHCGRCRKCCDTRKGYLCRSGKCRKPHTRKCACSKTKKCKGQSSCCKGKCVNLKHDCKNCGRCGTKCAFGSACCNGHCKNLTTDCKNCGKCGRKCPKGKVCCNGHCICLKSSRTHCGECGKHCRWGRKCCHGKCVSITRDEDNCGECGNKCRRNVKCTYGICGYGL